MADVSGDISVGERTGGFNSIYGYGAFNPEPPKVLSDGFKPPVPPVDPMTKWRMQQRPNAPKMEMGSHCGTQIKQKAVEVAVVKSHQAGWKTTSVGVHDYPRVIPDPVPKQDKSGDVVLNKDPNDAPTIDETNKEYSRWRSGYQSYFDGTFTGAKNVETMGTGEEHTNPQMADGHGMGGLRSGFIGEKHQGQIYVSQNL